MTSLASSYEMIGRILAKLVLGGLRSQGLRAEDAVESGIVSGDDSNHFHDVVTWLQHEGLITQGHAMMDGSFQRVQLTSTGIAAVEAGAFGPANVTIRETVEAKPEGDLPSETYGKMGSFVGGLLGGFTTAISS